MKLTRPISKSELEQLLESLQSMIEDIPESSMKENAVSALHKFEALRSDVTPDEFAAAKAALQYDLGICEDYIRKSIPMKKRLQAEKRIRDIRALLSKFLSASFD